MLPDTSVNAPLTAVPAHFQHCTKKGATGLQGAPGSRDDQKCHLGLWAPWNPGCGGGPSLFPLIRSAQLLLLLQILQERGSRM